MVLVKFSITKLKIEFILCTITISSPIYIICHSKEFSKALRTLHDLTSEPTDNGAKEDEEKKEHIERLREMTGRLRQLCSQEAGDGKVPNPFKLLQVHLKHMFIGSEQIRG